VKSGGAFKALHGAGAAKMLPTLSADQNGLRVRRWRGLLVRWDHRLGYIVLDSTGPVGSVGVGRLDWAGLGCRLSWTRRG
jgi:hypothetical protein